MSRNILDFTPCKPPAGSSEITRSAHIVPFAPIWVQDGNLGWWAYAYEREGIQYVYFMDSDGEGALLTVGNCFEQGFKLYQGGEICVRVS